MRLKIAIGEEQCSEGALLRVVHSSLRNAVPPHHHSPRRVVSRHVAAAAGKLQHYNAQCDTATAALLPRRPERVT